MKLAKRKNNRLKDFDYSKNGAYFITICTKNKKQILSKIVKNNLSNNVGACIARPPINELSKYGKIVENAILNISTYYPNVTLNKYVIMPNHVHLLLSIYNENGRALHAPTISHVIQQFKGIVTKQIGYPIWQKLFHDHIVRNETDYLKIWEYIDNNPLKWELDCYYK